MAVSVENLGMSLLQMGKDSESVRFLDDVDMTLSLVNQQDATQSVMGVEISCKPIVFRASYRDINLILAIANRAIALAAPPQVSTTNSAKKPVASLPPSTAGTASGRLSSKGEARVVMAKEQVGSFRAPSYCVAHGCSS
jgi:vacuolar protein sorting-associated protein 13A/C